MVSGTSDSLNPSPDNECVSTTSGLWRRARLLLTEFLLEVSGKMSGPGDEASMACCSGSNGLLKFKGDHSLIKKNSHLANYIIHCKYASVQDQEDGESLSF